MGGDGGDNPPEEADVPGEQEETEEPDPGTGDSGNEDESRCQISNILTTIGGGLRRLGKSLRDSFVGLARGFSNVLLRTWALAFTSAAFIFYLDLAPVGIFNDPPTWYNITDTTIENGTYAVQVSTSPGASTGQGFMSRKRVESAWERC